MGRRKGYEPDELVARATALFHAQGYERTSTQQLVEALRVNRNSMYAEFGSKEALFHASLARYEASVLEQLCGPLEATGAGLGTIDALFAQFGRDAAGEAAGLGCLLCNTAVELAGADPSGAGFVSRYFARLEAAYRHALTAERRRGGLVAGAVVADEARLLTATTLGIFVLVRGRAAPLVVQGATRAARALLERLAAVPVE